MEKKASAVAHWLLVVADALMAEYGVDLNHAVGGVSYESGERKRIFGFDMCLVNKLWPVMFARHGVERDGPTTEQDAYIRAANAKRAELEERYRIVN